MAVPILRATYSLTHWQILAFTGSAVHPRTRGKGMWWNAPSGRSQTPSAEGVLVMSPTGDASDQYLHQSVQAIANGVISKICSNTPTMFSEM
jgi:hypothetical protein